MFHADRRQTRLLILKMDAQGIEDFEASCAPKSLTFCQKQTLAYCTLGATTISYIMYARHLFRINGVTGLV